MEKAGGGEKAPIQVYDATAGESQLANASLKSMTPEEPGGNVEGRIYDHETPSLIPEVDRDFLVDSEDFVFSETTPRVPVFRPSPEEFKHGLARYVASVLERDEDVLKLGVVKVVPPDTWRWVCDEIDPRRLVKPINQFTSGARGVFRIDMTEGKDITLGEFREKAKETDLEIQLQSSSAVLENEGGEENREESNPAGGLATLGIDFFENKFWKSTSSNSAPVSYGSDNIGTLFPVDKEDDGLQGWNLNSLDSLLTTGFDFALAHRKPHKGNLSKEEALATLDFMNVSASSEKRVPKKNKLYVNEGTVEVEKEVKSILNEEISEIEGSGSEAREKEIIEKKHALSSFTLPGITSPMLYYGKWKSCFAWHTEDMDLFSVSYLHHGAPKIWYVVPRTQTQLFESTASTLFPEEANRCSEFMRHKNIMISPKTLKTHGITVAKLIQRQGEFIITFPRAYHAGFNAGFNVAEAVNFATKNWIPYGRNAQWCTCEDFTVKFSMDALIQNIRTHKPGTLSKVPKIGDLLLVQWRGWPGWHLVRVKKEKGQATSRQQEKGPQHGKFEVILMHTTGITSGGHKRATRAAEMWVIDTAVDTFHFPNNKRKAWPSVGDVIYVTIKDPTSQQEQEFAVELRDSAEFPANIRDSDYFENNKKLFTLTEEIDRKKEIQSNEETSPEKISVDAEEIADFDDTQSDNCDMVYQDEEDEDGPVIGLKRNAKAKDYGAVKYENVMMTSYLGVGDFGVFSFDATKVQWRWPDAKEMKLLKFKRKNINPVSIGPSGEVTRADDNIVTPVTIKKPKRSLSGVNVNKARNAKKSKASSGHETELIGLSGQDPAQVPVAQKEQSQRDFVNNYNINMNVNNNIFAHPGANATNPQNFQYSESYNNPEAMLMNMRGNNTFQANIGSLPVNENSEDSLWQQLKAHAKKKSDPILSGDIIVVKWADWDGEYMVKVGVNESGGFCVVSALDDPKFGSWDFDPRKDDWKRPKAKDLKLLLDHITKKQKEKLKLFQQQAATQVQSPAQQLTNGGGFAQQQGQSAYGSSHNLYQAAAGQNFNMMNSMGLGSMGIGGMGMSGFNRSPIQTAQQAFPGVGQNWGLKPEQQAGNSFGLSDSFAMGMFPRSTGPAAGGFANSFRAAGVPPGTAPGFDFNQPNMLRNLSHHSSADRSQAQQGFNQLTYSHPAGNMTRNFDNWADTLHSNEYNHGATHDLAGFDFGHQTQGSQATVVPNHEADDGQEEYEDAKGEEQ